jgi:hypothetical protein
MLPSVHDNLNSPRPKKAREVDGKVKSMLIIFFNIKVIFFTNNVTVVHYPPYFICFPE